MSEPNEQEKLLYGDLTARIRRMLEPAAHDSFLFHEDTIALLEPVIAPASKVLDAGCGRGTMTVWLAERGCNVVAIDPSEERLAHTRGLLREKELEDRARLEASHLPDAFPADIFDSILDCFSLWHISDWGRLFNLCKKNLKPHGRLVILDTFFYWKTTLEFRQQMRELWNTAPLTFNECKNMLIKRDFRLVKAEPIQEHYIRYLDAICQKVQELEREDIGTLDPGELKRVRGMWEWFRTAAHAEELVATMVVAELTEYE
jgi:cyclopropane fatty-acyl-phospholipid synthase-like methyltransferase